MSEQEKRETHADIIADMRTMYPASLNCEPTVSGQFVHDEMEWLANRLEAAHERELVGEKPRKEAEGNDKRGS